MSANLEYQKIRDVDFPIWRKRLERDGIPGIPRKHVNVSISDAVDAFFRQPKFDEPEDGDDPIEKVRFSERLKLDLANRKPPEFRFVKELWESLPS